MPDQMFKTGAKSFDIGVNKKNALMRRFLTRIGAEKRPRFIDPIAVSAFVKTPRMSSRLRAAARGINMEQFLFIW